MECFSLAKKMHEMENMLRRLVLRSHEALTGRHVLRQLEWLNHTQWLSGEDLLVLQRDKLQRLLDYVYHHVPYYRQTFDEVGFQPANFSRDPANFQKIPIITKYIMQKHAEAFKTTDPDVRRTLHLHSTSGSTGEPFNFYEDHTHRDNVTADILRNLTWCGWRFGESHVYLWGQPVERSLQSQLRGWLMDAVLNRFYSNAYLMTDESLAKLIRQIRRRRPGLMYGYAAALCHFAQFVQKQNIIDIRFHGVYSSGEILYPHQRELIEQTFACKVFNRYAANEVGGIACECEGHAGLHINVEGCYVEVVNGDVLIEDERPGDIVVTNLNNYGFPFIRYRLADIVQSSFEQGCPCRRRSPKLNLVRGRVVDIFKTVDGRVVWGDLEGTVFQVEGIKKSQVIQKALDHILIRLVCDNTFDQADLEKIERIVKKMMGATTKVAFEFPDCIPMCESGKFRYSYSEIVGDLSKDNGQD
jgi:phenylacetate-CoA ligase